MPDETASQQIPAEKSRPPARERVLPVAQIYAVVGAEPQGRSAMVTLVIGDERNDPKKHGIRATHGDWCALFTALGCEDPALRARLRETLRALPAD